MTRKPAKLTSGRVAAEADRLIESAVARRKRLAAQGAFDTPPPPPKRKHPKRHSVNRERAMAARAKAKRIAAKLAAQRDERERRMARVRAYFAGERPDLSDGPDA